MLKKVYTKPFLKIFLILVSVFLLCKCKEELMPLGLPTPIYSDTSSVTDIQGNTYKTVKIGNQWWMAQDLKVTQYNDGSPINYIFCPQGTTGNDTVFLMNWKYDTTGAYYTWNNPGLLQYNWYAVNNAMKLAPEGWHVATDADWMELEKFLGLDNAQANQILWRGNFANTLKSLDAWGTWFSDDVYPTNTSGFSAKDFGCRVYSGSRGGANSVFYWTSTLDSVNIDQAWYRSLEYNTNGVFRYYIPKSYGCSVRCVKD